MGKWILGLAFLLGSCGVDPTDILTGENFSNIIVGNYSCPNLESSDPNPVTLVMVTTSPTNAVTLRFGTITITETLSSSGSNIEWSGSGDFIRFDTAATPFELTFQYGSSSASECTFI